MMNGKCRACGGVVVWNGKHYIGCYQCDVRDLRSRVADLEEFLRELSTQPYLDRYAARFAAVCGEKVQCQSPESNR